MKVIKKSMDGFCADSSSVFPTWQKTRLKKEWFKDAQLFRGITTEGDRVVLPVKIATDYHQTVYMMDAVTGTLYKDGKCKTSDHLQLLDVIKVDGLIQELMKIKMKALGA